MKKFLKAFAVMIVFSVCSCGEKNTENIPVPVTQTMYKEEHLNMPEYYNIFEYFFIYMRPLSLLDYILKLYWYKWYTELLTSPFTPI